MTAAFIVKLDVTGVDLPTLADAAAEIQELLEPHFDMDSVAPWAHPTNSGTSVSAPVFGEPSTPPRL